MEYSKAGEEVLKVVSEMAEKNHPRLGGHELAVLMQDKATEKAGKIILATASLPPARMKPLLAEEVEFVICIAADQWANLTPEKRQAVVDHELCHCGLDADTGKPYIRGHDYEEFGEVAERHGFWREDFGEAQVQQAFSGILPKVKVSTLTK